MAEKEPQALSLNPKLSIGPNSVILDYSGMEVVTRRLVEIRRKVEGEISFRQQSPNGKYQVFLVPQHFSFLSSSARKDLLRTLQDRRNDLPWLEIIEDVCDHVVQYCRKGEPEAIIDPGAIILHSPTYLLYPYLPRNQPSIIYGKRGSAKSSLAMILSICVAYGWEDNPWFEGVSTNKINTLWLDWETDQEGWEYDYKRLLEGNYKLSLEKPAIIYRRCRGSLADQIERVKEIKHQHKCLLTIIDSIAPASGGDIKEAGAAIAFHDALRYLGDTTLSVGHPPKANTPQTSSVSGAGQYEDLARAIWEVSYDQDEDSPTGHQVLIHRKPYKTAYLKPQGLRYEYSPELITVNKEDPRKIAKFVEQMNLQTQILDILRLKPLTLPEMVTALKSNYRSTSSTLTKLKNKGLIVQLPEQRWGLVSYQQTMENDSTD